MALCVQVNPDNTLTALPAAADCSTGYVLVSSSEFDQMTMNPFYLSSDQALQIGSAVLLVWATAFCLRLLRNYLLERDSENE